MIEEADNGQSYGYAPNTTLIAVKILDNHGIGSLSSLLRGLNWVMASVEKKGRQGMSVVSLPGLRTWPDSLKDAIAGAEDEGLYIGWNHETQDISADQRVSSTGNGTNGAGIEDLGVLEEWNAVKAVGLAASILGREGVTSVRLLMEKVQKLL